MQITCPECKFAREVDETRIPARSQVATCPKCQTKFKFRDLPEPDFIIEEPAAEAEPEAEAAPERKPVSELPLIKASQPEPKQKTAPKAEAKAEPKQTEPERTFPDLEAPNEDSGDALWQRLHSMTPPQTKRAPRDEPRDEAPYEAQDEPPYEAPSARDSQPRETWAGRHEADDRPEIDEQPVSGWTGEFNSDFPDPMQDEFKDEEEDARERPVQVPPPFEQLDRYGFFRGFFLTLKLVMTSPRLFFSVMPVGNGLSKPLTFAILVAMIQALAQYAWGVAGLTPGVDVTDQGFQTVAYDSTSGLFELLFTPAMVALTLFIITGFYHAILSALKSGEKGFEGSFRAVAYAYAPMITGIIPMFSVEFMAGWMFLYAIWGMVLTAVGLKYIHKTNYSKVIPVLLLPLLLGMIVVFMMQVQMPSV